MRAVVYEDKKRGTIACAINRTPHYNATGRPSDRWLAGELYLPFAPQMTQRLRTLDHWGGTGGGEGDAVVIQKVSL